MSLRHSILQENSQPRHMHRSTYDRKIWLLMTPSSLDGLTAIYIYIPQLKKRSTFFALTIPSEWSPSPTYRLLVFPKSLASDTETYIGTLKLLGSPGFVSSLNMSSNHLKARRRSDYVYFLTHRTRWSDNDMYLHMNNSIYYQLFDLIVNIYLIERCGFTPPLIGLVVSSHFQVCYSKPSLYLLISMIAMIVFFASRIPSSRWPWFEGE